MLLRAVLRTPLCGARRAIVLPRPAWVRALSSGGKPPKGGARRPEEEEEEDEDDLHEFMEEHPAILRRMDAVKGLHERYAGLCAELAGKIEALELDYEKKLQPLLERRAQIVMGVSEPVDAEAKPLEDYLEAMSAPPGEAESGIPGFWLTAISEHEALGDSVTEADAALLEFLQDISCSKFGAGERKRAVISTHGPGKSQGEPEPAETDSLPGFELRFRFAPNPYFANAELLKKVWTDDGYPAASEGSKISWKPGKDLTYQTVVKHSKRQNRKVKTLERVPSFFHFFESRTFDLDEEAIAGGGGGGHDGDEGSAAESELSRQMEDLRMTLSFKDELVPNAAEWVTIMDSDEGDEPPQPDPRVGGSRRS